MYNDQVPPILTAILTGTAAEVTPVSEIGPYKFAIGDITRKLMDDFTALVHPAKAVAAAG